MRASKLIAELEKIIQKHGDLPIYLCIGGTGELRATDFVFFRDKSATRFLELSSGGKLPQKLIEIAGSRW